MAPRNFASIQYIEDKAGVYTIPPKEIPKTSGPVITTFIVSAI